MIFNSQRQILFIGKSAGKKLYESRFAKLTTTLQAVLKEENCEFMHNDHLGWILTCPSNLGTGLRAGAMVKVPLFSGRSDFKEVCKKMGLQARGTKGTLPQFLTIDAFYL